MTTHIYTLADPKDGVPRYIGKTLNLEKRLKCHASSCEGTAKGKWIRRLKKSGRTPIIEPLEAIHHDANDCTAWRDAERFWIQMFRSWGFKLLNCTDGGEGSNREKSLEQIRRERELMDFEQLMRCMSFAKINEEYERRENSDVVRRWSYSVYLDSIRQQPIQARIDFHEKNKLVLNRAQKRALQVNQWYYMI